MEADYPPRWDGFKRRRMYLLYLYVSARSEWGIPARRLQMADAAVFAETVSGLFREAGVPERAAARIHEVCTRHLLGWRGGLNIYTGYWTRGGFSISFLYIILLYPFRYIYIVLSILSITARRKAAAIPNVRDKPPRGLHRRPSVPRRRYSLTPPARPKTRRRQRAKKAGG